MLQKSSIWATAQWFFENPISEIYLTELSKKIKLAHTSVKKNLKKLTKHRIIEELIEEKGSRKFPKYKARINSKEYRKYKKIYNYTSILESGVIEFLEISIMPRAIVLFGSYKKGEDTEDSDIDLYLESKYFKVNLTSFEKLLNRRIQLHFNKDFKTYPKELRNNIINGFVLYGYLEVFK